MNCPTCGAPLSPILYNKAQEISLCRECGTVRDIKIGQEIVIVPKLVERCREFEKELHGDGFAMFLPDQWQSLGIAESISKPEDRK